MLSRICIYYSYTFKKGIFFVLVVFYILKRLFFEVLKIILHKINIQLFFLFDFLRFYNLAPENETLKRIKEERKIFMYYKGVFLTKVNAKENHST